MIVARMASFILTVLTAASVPFIFGGSEYLDVYRAGVIGALGWIATMVAIVEGRTRNKG